MDAEDCMDTNRYWTRLKMEWEPVSIDLDDEAYGSQESSPSHKYYADYYDNFPYINRSFIDLSKSPYGIREFSKRMSSGGDRSGGFAGKRRRFYDNGPTSLPIFTLSPEKSRPSRTFTREASTSPGFDFNIENDYKSIEKICNYIDSIYESINNFVSCGKENTAIGVNSFKTPPKVHNSLSSVSGLSFDDTFESCDLELECNEKKCLRKNDNDVKVHRINVSVHESTGSKPTRTKHDLRLRNPPEVVSDKIDRSGVKDFWMRLSDSVPPPPIENDDDIKCVYSKQTPYRSEIIEKLPALPERGHNKITESTISATLPCSNLSRRNIASNEVVISCEDRGLEDKSSDSSTDYELFAMGASMAENSDGFISYYLTPSRDSSSGIPTGGCNLSGNDATVYLDKSNSMTASDNYFNFRKDHDWSSDKCQSLPADIIIENPKSWPTIKPPENDLQKNSADRVLSEHQLRVQRSLQKLNLPDWYKNSPVPREGFLLKKRASDAGSNSGRGWQQQQAGLGGKTTSLGSLGGGVPTRQLALTPPSHYQQPGFTRWSTSRLNSAQTSPCSSARSSVRCGAVSPLNSPARPPRVPRPTRPPYLGWRSQERLASPRTPHERLAVSLLPASPPVPANTTEEIQTSIKEVTSAIVHYVSGLEPGKEVRPSSPRGSPRLCWVESSFVGTKPLESPQTPVVVSQLTPPHEQQINHNSASERNGHANHAQQHNNSHHNNLHQQQRPLQLELHPTATLAATTYQHEWQASQHSLLNLAVSKPSPGSTTLEDVLDSLLGLPPAAPRVPSPQTSPRRSTSPYYILGLQSRYNERSNSQTSSLQFSLSSKTDDRSTEYRTASRISGDTFDSLEPSQQDGDQQLHGRRRSSAESSSCSTLAPGTDGADKEENSRLISLPKIRLRAKSAVAGKHSSRRQSEPAASQKSVSLDRRVSYDSHISRGDLTLSRTTLSDLQQSKTSLKSITSINTDASTEDPLVHCRYTKCTSATNHSDARRNYKSCHNCNYVYCSRECRRAHWEKHRKVCLHSRASALCRQILSTAKEDRDSLHHISTIAQKGYLSNGRGVVKVFFTSPDAAEKFTTNGFQSLGEPAYVTWPDLAPTEMGPELYAELIKLCKSYNPETRLVLYVAVCIISEVPTKGAVVKWERQLVSRCAKLRLSKTVMGKIPHGQLPFHSSPKAKVRSKDKHHKEKDVIYKAENIETLILTSNSANLHRGGDVSVQKIRELSFNNIQMQLHRRGVNLKRHFPEVYSKLCAYVEGVCDKFTPMTVYPRDNLTGKSFMCVIMPETEPDKFLMLPSDSVECHTIDVSIDHSDQVSTPM